jgi:hypothetical protein
MGREGQNEGLTQVILNTKYTKNSLPYPLAGQNIKFYEKYFVIVFFLRNIMFGKVCGPRHPCQKPLLLEFCKSFFKDFVLLTDQKLKKVFSTQKKELARIILTYK